MKVLLTGASGFLGKEIYNELGFRGIPVIGMSRRSSDLSGDITKPGLNLDHFVGEEQIDTVIHSAAYLSFSNSEKEREKVFSVNYQGTENVKIFCMSHKIPNMVYISTAYVCGDHQGAWKESYDDRGQSFHNPYEEMKLRSELMLKKIPRPLNLTIIRPSIIIGRSTDGCGDSLGGFYGPLRAIAKAMKIFEERVHLPKREKSEDFMKLPRLCIPLHLTGDPDSPCNLIPVDYVAKKTCDLIGHDGTFHLTAHSPLSNQQILDLICQELGIEGPRVVKDLKLTSLLDKIYFRMTRDFTPYMDYQPEFESSVKPDESLTKEYTCGIIKAIKYWRSTERVE